MKKLTPEILTEKEKAIVWESFIQFVAARSGMTMDEYLLSIKTKSKDENR